MSLRAGPHWQLEDEEKRELGDKLAAALATLPAGKLPPWLAELVRVAESCAPWVAFGTAAVAVAMPRVLLTKMQQEQAAQDARDAAAANDGARVVGTIHPQPEAAQYGG